MARDVWKPVLAAFAVVLLGAGSARADQIDPDQSAKVSTDVNLALRTIAPGEYELVIQNQSSLGFIDSFAWVPGPGWHVTAVIRSSKGACVVSNSALSCHGKIDPPKRCTCQPGGQMRIRFRMSGPANKPASGKAAPVNYGTAGGYIVVKTMTMVHRHIPTTLPPANE